MGEAGAGSTDDGQLVRRLRAGWWAQRPERYWLTRFVYLRALGFIHVVAFTVLVAQVGPLIGSDGLLPAADYVAHLHATTPFLQWPTLFWWGAPDLALQLLAWLGLVLAVALMLGVDNAVLIAALWTIYLSYCHVGQVFWGYGWEMLLLEATFLAIFLCPVRSVAPMSPGYPPPTPVIWMLRWLVFRLMFGAGMIKLRGDDCWVDLTCLQFHYETQPVPHPLSWLLHQAPPWFHRAGVSFNHVVELLAPWFVFGPRLARRIAGVMIIAFQGMLILSGNLSFLNWLSIAVAIACFDDALLGRLLPRRVAAGADACEGSWADGSVRRLTVGALSLLVAVLSIGPVTNMLSSRQAMNTSFDPLHLVNSYGAFGSVGRERYEVVLEGTWDEPSAPNAEWREYAFPCKPGDVRRRPCVITPYHYRLDWQMWFAAFGDPGRQAWLVHLVYKLLRGESGATRLLDGNPFVDRPPRFIRAELYRYRFTRLGDGDGDGDDAWWRRRRVSAYLPPMSLQHAGMRDFLSRRGWLR